MIDPLAAVSFLVIVWSWCGYPFMLWSLSRLRSAQAPRTSAPPASVSIVIPVHNAAEALRSRLAELSWIRDWSGEIEVLIALDGCTDQSEAVARDALQPGFPLRIVLVSGRRGKSNAQNCAVAEASGDILVLNDVGSTFHQDALPRLLEPLADPDVGYVAGDLRWNVRGVAHEEAGGLYTKLERAMWGWEGTLGLLHVASGAFMAVRRELWVPLADDVGDDAATPLDVLGQGHRGAFAPAARALDDFSTDLRSELRARTRMTSRSLRATLRGFSRWGLWRRPALAGAVVSHRLLRWTTPFWGLLFAAAVTPAVLGLAGDLSATVVGTSPALLIAGVLAVAAISALQPVRRVLAFGLAFAVVNLGFFLGVLHVLRGGRIGAYATSNRR